MLSRYLKGEEPRQLLEKRMREEGRLPPGQSASLKWPVLHVGADPVFDAATWHFKTGGLVEGGPYPEEAGRKVAALSRKGVSCPKSAGFLES